MAIEDFTTYTEVDPNSRISKTASRTAWTDLDGNETAYVYKDKGADFFSSSLVHYLTVYITAIVDGALVAFWALTNDLNDLRTIDNAGGSWLSVYMIGVSGAIWLGLSECDSGSVMGDNYITAALDTPYYLKIVRDESVGTYGTIYCYIYSDSARTTLVDTMSQTLRTSKKDFRYIHAVNTYNASATPFLGSGYTENLEFISLPSPTVTIQAMTDVVTTTATGNGNVTGLGVPTATQHGHCWAITSNPTTADSKVENGIPTTGAFTSSLTGLTEGIRYYTRAYITNDNGTSYSNQVIFTAGTDYSTGAIFPSDAVTRVTSLTHRYDRGTYTLELNLGEVVADFGLPEWDSKPKKAVPKEEEPVEEQVKRVVEETTSSPFTPSEVMEPLFKKEAKRRQVQAEELGIIAPTARTIRIQVEEADKIAILREIERMSRSSRVPGITEYARDVFRRAIIRKQEELQALYD